MSQFVIQIVFDMVPHISGCFPIHIHMYGLTKVVKVSLSFNHFSLPILYLWVLYLTILSTGKLIQVMYDYCPWLTH